MPSHTRIRDEYLRLREIQRSLNKALLKSLTKRAIEQSARDLGMWEAGKIVVEHEDHMGVLWDYAQHDYRVGGKNAVERRLARGDVAEGSDEHRVLAAMADARFTLVEIQEIVPDLGARAFDHVYGKRFLLVDVGIAKIGETGLLLATRLLPFKGWMMTSGAPLPLDPELAKLFLDGVRGGVSDLTALRLVAHEQRKHIAKNLIALALEEPAMVKVAWRERMAEEARA
jgi:hypothetical protein